MDQTTAPSLKIGRYIATTRPPMRLGQACDGVVHLLLEEVRDLAEHGVELAGLLADRHHLHHHGGEDVGTLHCEGEACAGADIALDLPRGDQIDVVAGGAADRIERLDQRDAGGEHRRQRARPARDGGLADDRTDHREAQQRSIERDLHRGRALIAPGDEHDRPDQGAEYEIPGLHEEVRHCDHHHRRCRQVGAEAGEHALELGNHEQHHHRDHQAGDYDHGSRVEQRRLDLALDGEDLFLVGGDAVEQAVEDARLLAGSDQVAEQLVELDRVLGEGLRQVEAGLDVGADLVEQA
jgi:hypothetical protein